MPTQNLCARGEPASWKRNERNEAIYACQCSQAGKSAEEASKSSNYLLTGLVQGFLAGLLHLPAVSFTCKNLLSAKKEPEMVDALLEKEI